MSNDLSARFDRITYRDGQLLTARDLNDEQLRHSRLRAAHNLQLHDTWGIALGFRAQIMDDSRGVIVGSGYAIDEAGRDILLAGSVSVPVPDVNGPEMFVLTASYRKDQAFGRRREMIESCPDKFDRNQERPDFQWHRPLDARFGLQVPLVAVTVAQGTIQGGLNLSVRRNARPNVRPHVNYDITEAGQTGWQAWTTEEGAHLGLEVAVDTSEAGFHRKPQYFATLEGDLSNREGEAPLFQGAGWPAEIQPTLSPEVFGFIADVSADGFTYRIVCAGQPPFGRIVTAKEAEDRRWHLTWFGVEPVTGGEPVFDLTKIILHTVFL